MRARARRDEIWPTRVIYVTATRAGQGGRRKRRVGLVPTVGRKLTFVYDSVMTHVITRSANQQVGVCLD